MPEPYPTVVGRYQIVQPLGRGRLGDLFLATDPVMERDVALRLVPDLADGIRAAFTREARGRAAVQHQTIAPIYDFGEHEGHLYFTRPFIPGQTLEEIIAAKAPVPVARRVEWMAVLCSALAYAHRAGCSRLALEHADVVIRNDGTPTIVEFGLLQVIEYAMASRSPAYLSPEELSGLPGDHRSDIFVAGAVCYELITYEKAFAYGSAEEIRQRVAMGAGAIRADALEPILASIVTRALQVDPADRYQDFEAFASDLARACKQLDRTESDSMPDC